MSKSFWIAGIVASFVFACSFLAAIPVQADMASYVLDDAYEWVEIAGVTYTDSSSSDGYDGGVRIWDFAGDMTEPLHGTASLRPDYTLDNRHWVLASGFTLSPGTQVVAKIAVAPGKSVLEFFGGLTTTSFYAGGPSEGEISFDPPSAQEGETYSTGGDEQEPPNVMYLTGLEQYFANQNVEIKINSDVVSEYAMYSIVFYKSAAASSDVPEPATLAVFGLGLLGTGLVASRKRNKK